MGVGVSLEDENGSTIQLLRDDPGVLSRAIAGTAESTCLGAIDPYGDTTFNRLQIPRLLSELREAARPRNPSDEQWLSELEALAQTVADGYHLYLKFFGD